MAVRPNHCRPVWAEPWVNVKNMFYAQLSNVFTCSEAPSCVGSCPRLLQTGSGSYSNCKVYHNSHTKVLEGITIKVYTYTLEIHEHAATPSYMYLYLSSPGTFTTITQNYWRVYTTIKACRTRLKNTQFPVPVITRNFLVVRREHAE